MTNPADDIDDNKTTPETDEVQDMISLKTLSEASILQNIKTRYLQNTVYTYTGSILVALNPFQNLPIYEPAVIKEYAGSGGSRMVFADRQPHIFAIAEAAFWNLSVGAGGSAGGIVNQSVIISGESGSGKSESTKHILQYLTTRTSPPSTLSPSNPTNQPPKQSQIQAQILDANVILESFGNAKTTQNNNSSRFGKFIQVHISPAAAAAGTTNHHLTITSASITTYLLEKSRVSRQPQNERNYHVFYQLVCGCDATERTEYQISALQSYDYLSHSGCTSVAGLNDATDFVRLKSALRVLDMSSTEMSAVFRTLSAILWIGNIGFVGDEDSDTVRVRDTQVTAVVAGLLGVDTQRFGDCLVVRKLSVRGETTLVPVKPGQAIDNRNSIAKSLYDNLFLRLVDFMNRALASSNPSSLDQQQQQQQQQQPTHPQNYIGVLDIFGFEDFKTNSLEQLCINYANEKLQQFFTQLIFKQEQDIYESEGISWEKITFTDNRACLELIEARTPVGILALLDEETRVPRGSDETCLGKLEREFAKHACYIRPKIGAGQFGIRHYAGDVLYSVAGFLEKNRDAVSEELVEIVRASSSPWIANTFTAGKVETLTASSAVVQPISRKGSSDQLAKGPASSTTTSSKTTSCAYFKNQLISLLSTLTATTPHYVRCIKPNGSKAAFVFDDELVSAQLRYTGMLDTIRIRKSGFTVRIPYPQFVQRFKCIVPNALASEPDPRKVSLAVIQSSVTSDSWQAGKTQVFMRDETLSEIQATVHARLNSNVLSIQRVVRGHLARKRYKKQRAHIIVIQKLARGMVCRVRQARTLKVITMLQSRVRGSRARKVVGIMRARVLLLQRVVRGFVCRRAYARAREGIICCQRVCRGRVVRLRYLRVLDGIRRDRVEAARGLEVERVEGERRVEDARVLEVERVEGERRVEAARVLEAARVGAIEDERFARAQADVEAAAAAVRAVEEAREAGFRKSEGRARADEQDRVQAFVSAKGVNDATATIAQAKDVQSDQEKADANSKDEKVRVNGEFERLRNEREVVNDARNTVKAVDEVGADVGAALQKSQEGDKAKSDGQVEAQTLISAKGVKNTTAKATEDKVAADKVAPQAEKTNVDSKASDQLQMSNKVAPDAHTRPSAVQASPKRETTLLKTGSSESLSSPEPNLLSKMSFNSSSNILSESSNSLSASTNALNSSGKKLSSVIKAKMMSAATGKSLKSASSIGDLCIAALKKDQAEKIERLMALPLDSSELSLSAFVKDYCRAGIDADERLRFSKIPIDTSYTKVSDKLDKLALDTFAQILYLQTPNVKHPHQNYKILLTILKNGLDNADLRDEIILQLCAQVTAPKGELPIGWDSMQMSGWLALQVVTSTFKPSARFSRFVEAFATQTVQSYGGDEHVVKRFARSVIGNLKTGESYMTEKRRYPFVTIEGGRAWARSYNC